MKRFAWFWAVAFSVLSSQFSSPPSAKAQSSFYYGMNWLDLLSGSAEYTAEKALFNDSMQCNMYHIGYGDSLSQSDLNRWANNMTNAQFVPVHYGGAIQIYSGAERLKYTATYKPQTNDTLTNYYFLSHDITTGDTANGYWQIDSGSHSDDKVLWSNEFPCEWRDDANHPLDIALKLQVAAVNASSANHVVDVYVIWYRSSNHTYDTLRTYGVQWNRFATADSDYVFFDTAKFRFNLSPDYFTQTYDSLLVEVHSKRYVVTRLAWVCVEDSNAHNLMASFDLNTTDTSLQNLRTAAKNAILADTLAVYDSLVHAKLFEYYLRDEPPISEYLGTGQVNGFINYRGSTELGGYPTRFIANAHPKNFYWFGGVTTSVIEQVAMDLDAPDTHVLADSYFNNNTPAWSAAATYSVSTNYVAKIHNDNSFDPFEFREGAFTSKSCNQLASIGALDSVLKADTMHGAWWNNMFIHAVVNSDSFSSNPPPVPEQIQQLTNVGWCMGAKGALYYTGVTTGVPGKTGFADTNAAYTTDWTTYGGHSLPTMYKRNSLWGIKYAKWLRAYGDTLAAKYWRGCFVRHGYEELTGGVYVEIATKDEQFGSTSLFIDTSGDKMTRPIIDSFPGSTQIHDSASWMNYRKLYAGDALVKDTLLPDSLKWVCYGFFSNDSSAISAGNPLFMGICNLWCDGRDLLCRFFDDGDTGTYIRRGTRKITTKLSMNPATSTYWKITEEDGAATWDTIIAYNQTFTRTYLPAEMKIYKVEPYYTAHIGTGDIPYNNGRRAELDTLAKTYRFAYFRSDSVLYRQSLDSIPVAWTRERVLAAGAPADTFGHPSLRILQTTLFYTTAVVYEKADAANYYVFMRTNEQTGDTTWDTPILIGQIAKDSEEFTPTPVLAPCARDTGFVVAWSANRGGVAVRAVDLGKRALTAGGDTTVAPTFSPTLYVTAYGHSYNYGANVQDPAAGFPSIAEDSGTSGFGLAFQQERTGYASQIFFTTGVCSYGGGAPTLSVDSVPDWVSRMYGPDCPNAHPSLDRSHSCNAGALNVFLLPGGSAGAFSAWIPGTHPAVGPAYYPWYWNIAWDAPQALIEETYSCHGIYTQNVAWEALDDMRDALPAQHWLFNLFAPAMSCSSDQYYYPSLRAYDGADSLSSLPVAIGWQTRENTVLFARSPSAYPPALPAKPNTFVIAPLQESGIAQTAVLTPPSAAEPNLEMTGHGNPWYSRQRAFYKDLRQPDLRVLVNPLAAMDTAGSWMWKSNVYYQLQDTNVTSCIQLILWEAVTGSSVSDSTPSLVSRVQFTTLKLPQDSTAVKTGLIAVSDTVHIGKADSTLTIRRSCFSPDTVGLAAAIGGGQARFYTEAASYATGATLLSVDSLNMHAANLGMRDSTITVHLGSLKDSAIFFRLRVVDTNVRMLRGIAAQSYRILDTTAIPAGFAKAIGGDSAYMGRAGMVAAIPNPLNLTVAPNPVHDRTNVSFTIPDIDDAENTTEVVVFDMLAHTVATLAKDQLTLGEHTVTFNAANLPSGSYVVAVHTQNHMQSKLMILTK